MSQSSLDPWFQVDLQSIEERTLRHLAVGMAERIRDLEGYQQMLLRSCNMKLERCEAELKLKNETATGSPRSCQEQCWDHFGRENMQEMLRLRQKRSRGVTFTSAEKALWRRMTLKLHPDKTTFVGTPNCPKHNCFQQIFP